MNLNFCLRKQKNLIFLFFLSFLIFSSGICFSKQVNRRYKEGEILVKFKSGVSAASKSNFHTSNHTEVSGKIASLNVDKVKLPPGMSVEEAVKIYNNNPNVEYAEPNYIYHVSKTPNDSYFDELWGLHNTGQEVPPPSQGGGVKGTEDADIDGPEAWSLNTGSSDIVVAVIDTGIKLNHEDLRGNLWINSDEVEDNSVDDDGNGYIDDYHGYDFVDDDGTPEDVNDPNQIKDGHGTHISGIIGAVGDNGTGVTGVSWSVSLMALRALDTDGDGLTSDIIDAIDYAKNNGADIVNCSFAGEDFSTPLRDAIDNASNLLFVCAAGNNGDGTKSSGWDVDDPSGDNRVYPACYDLDNIIAVAATDQDDKLTNYSNYGTTSIDVAGPGGDDDTVNVLSTFHTYSTSYAYWAGTSMSTAYVSGLAALMLSRKPSLSVASLKGKIINGVDVKDSLVDKIKSGGRINAYSSLGSISIGDGEAGGGNGGGGGTQVCFIATAVYKNPDAWQVKKLREFRDKYLITNPLGKKIMDLYYKIGPNLAQFATHHPVIEKSIRWVLDKFLYFYSKLSIIYELGLIY